jgi:hypothetical protein
MYRTKKTLERRIQRTPDTQVASRPTRDRDTERFLGAVDSLLKALREVELAVPPGVPYDRFTRASHWALSLLERQLVEHVEQLEGNRVPKGRKQQRQDATYRTSLAMKVLADLKEQVEKDLAELGVKAAP